MTDHNLDAYRTWIDSVLRPLVRKPLIEGMVRKWSVPSDEAVKAIGWLFDEVDFLKAAADNCMSERDAALAEVERLKANQQPDGGQWRVEYGNRHTGKAPVSWHAWPYGSWCRDVWYGPPRRFDPLAEPVSDSAASDTRPESTTDQTAPQTP